MYFRTLFVSAIVAAIATTANADPIRKRAEPSWAGDASGALKAANSYATQYAPSGDSSVLSQANSWATAWLGSINGQAHSAPPPQAAPTDGVKAAPA
ncbi:uncharacterized protein MJAP1_000017 [Malassezia japonica]|uniref:Uncharacterized protein n=1 Tax=Malassezia japonica TaxID=223818 RepID=A0AAF0EZJ1_9BASI|nr:uncharacterized protein MJAP1_000017 [Malassezia japonica]WFD37076.1 hypothetical protein MJAP1_000017 [Malassezia japonica]